MRARYLRGDDRGDEAMQTLTPMRAEQETRSHQRRGAAEASVSSRAIVGGGRGARPPTGPGGNADLTTEADERAGFDMFVEKCADGTETMYELQRRWGALSDARRSTWARLARLRSSLTPMPGEEAEPEPAPAPAPQPYGRAAAGHALPPPVDPFQTPVRRAREPDRPHSAQFPIERPPRPVSSARDTPRGARDRGGGGAGDGGRREPSSPGRARGGGGGGPATSRREERSRPITHPQTTLIYLDWDDTLFPTSALLDSGFLVESYGQLGKPQPFPPDIQQELEQLDDSACKFVTTAIGLGKVVLITNAAEGWVTQSSALAVPRMAELFRRHRIPVVYAREVDNAEQRWENPARWKAAAFVQEAEAARTQLRAASRDKGARAPPLNIVSIGDQLFERVASHAAARVWDLVKTVKLLEDPDIKMAKDQLDMLNDVLGDLCANTKSEDMDMSTGDGG